MSALALIDEIVATRAQVAQDPDKLGRIKALLPAGRAPKCAST